MSSTMRRTATGRSKAERIAAFRKLFVDALHQQQASALNQAIATYRRALKLNPCSAETFSNLAGILTEKGRLVEAGNCRRKAIELSPTGTPSDEACNVLKSNPAPGGTRADGEATKA